MVGIPFGTRDHSVGVQVHREWAGAQHCRVRRNTASCLRVFLPFPLGLASCEIRKSFRRRSVQHAVGGLRIGLIYLCADSAGDLEQAHSYLQRAGKYAFVAAQPDAARAAGVMQLADGDNREQREHELFAAAVLCDFCMASIALQRLSDAAAAVQRAMTVPPDYLPARVQHVRVLSAMADATVRDEALRLLRERPEAADAFADDQLLADAGVRDALATYRQEHAEKDAALLNDLASRIGTAALRLKF